MKKFIIKNKYKITKPLYKSVYRGNNKVNSSLFAYIQRSSSLLGTLWEGLTLNYHLTGYRLQIEGECGLWFILGSIGVATHTVSLANIPTDVANLFFRERPSVGVFRHI